MCYQCVAKRHANPSPVTIYNFRSAGTCKTDAVWKLVSARSAYTTASAAPAATTASRRGRR